MFIPVGEAELYSVSFGPASPLPLVGLGGWIGSWELWAEPFSLLSESWRTISFDHRGSGATIAPVDSITFDRLVEDVFAVLDSLGVERCVLAGESAGGAVALAAALRRPERIAGLVIVDGAWFRGPDTGDDPFLTGLRHNYAQTLDWFVQVCTPEPDSEAIRHWGRQIIDRASQEAAIALYTAFAPVDLRGDVQAIHQPALILHGEADGLVPLASSQLLAASLPNATLTVLPGAGHVPTLTRPQEVAQAIDAFLAGFAL